jgi:hypothetical protein
MTSRPWRIALALWVGVTMGGCARYYWSKPDSTIEQFARDSQECARQAAAARGAPMDQVYRGCLYTRGYTRDKQMEPPPPGSYRGMDDEGFSVSRRF